MDQELKIEHYLLQLDRELAALPVGQRAEIITEIKSHIRDASERDAKIDLDSILRNLGSAKTVADRYLLAKGLATDSQPRARMSSGGGHWFKWLAIGTVVFMAFIFFSGLAVIWYFSPLIKIDESRGRVTLLGGMIDVNEELGQVKVGHISFKEAFTDRVPGVQYNGSSDNLAAQNVKRVRIPFNTAKLDLRPGTGSQLIWSCSASAKMQLPKVEVLAGVATLNLDSLSLAKCLIRLPADILTEVRGVNGHMDVERPTAALDIELANGKVSIVEDPKQTYDFDVNVKNGLQDFFPRSANPSAVKVRVSVTNGMVKKE